jgi:hypothetical protein
MSFDVQFSISFKRIGTPKVYDDITDFDCQTSLGRLLGFTLLSDRFMEKQNVYAY